MSTAGTESTAALRSSVPIPALDLVVGTAAAVGGVVGSVLRRVSDVSGPLTARVLSPALTPPMLSPRLHPARLVDGLTRRGYEERLALQDALQQVLDVVVPAVLAEVLAHVDLTTTVKDNVDIEEIVDGVDLNAVVRKVDLVAIVEEVITAVDLPEIIRQSTGAVTSETVRGVRMQGIAADDAVARVVDRLLPHRHRKPTVIDLNGAGTVVVTTSPDAPAISP